ncbi:hypothetical protein IFM89_014105 [Coptis chinensis]|uniref:Replication factor A C-terminal domain-containing protein n=1 Tax=Coptis chinensis TaxID=261450 RepID=A0A835HTL1_9MAGN|nr:hypothetical protein IFM89_014105 [Coptis chinensis]
MFRKGLMLKEIFLKNSIGTELKINLWENAIQLMDNAITFATSVPVLVVTSLTVRSYYDKYFLNSTSATKIYVNLEIPEVLELQNSSTFKERNISMLQASSSVEHNMKDRSLRNRKTLSQILQMLNGDSVGQVFTCTAIINDIVHDYAPFYKSCTKIGCRKKVIDKGDHYWCNNCNNAIPSPDARYQLKARIRDDTESTLITIFGDEAEALLKHPASELEKLMESANGIQTVKAIIDEIIGTLIVFEIKISQYNIQSQGKYGFTANKVFQVDYKLDSLQIQEDIEQVTGPSQILNDTFQAQLPDNMHQNSSTLVKEKQLPLERSTDIPNSSNKKNRTDKTYKRKAYVVISTEDSNESSQTSVIRPPSKRVRKIKENKKHKGYLLSRFIGLSDKDLRLPWGKRKLLEMRIFLLRLNWWLPHCRHLVPYPITDPDVETDSKPFDRDREPIADLFRDRNPVLATPILVAI